MKDIKVSHQIVDPGAQWVLDDEFVSPGVDQAKIQQAVLMILEAIGDDPHREGLKDTPERVARMYSELFAGMHQNPKDILATRFHVDHEEVVLVKDIFFYSLCEHHLLPFFGVAHVAYIPKDGVVTGLSKLARLVDLFARRPQVQERMTNQIAETLHQELTAQGTFVMIEAEHLCMSMRGIQKPNSRTVTTAGLGILTGDSVIRHELLRSIR